MKIQRKIKQDMKNRKKLNSDKAITLVALVVTIVVLLILAGVSIQMLAGDDGIIRQAKNAKDKTNEANAKERIEVEVIGSYGATGGLEIDLLNENLKTIDRLKYKGADFSDTNKITSLPATVELDGVKVVINGDGSTEKYQSLADLKTSQDPVRGNTTLTDDNGDSVTIPDGFNVASESPTNVIEGIVVEDRVDNQYVWIPVFEKSESRDWGVDYSSVTTSKTAANSAFTDTDYTNIETALKTYTATYKSSSYTDVWYGDSSYGQYGYYNGTEFIYYTNGNMTKSEYNTLYHNMLVSVYKNGGFYIGRYEMGTGIATDTASAQKLTRTSMSEYTATYTNANNTAPSISGMPTPVSKANAVGYTYITQSQAQMLAEKTGTENGYGTTTSSLMFGVQWDAVCVFLEKYGKTSDGTQFNSSYLTNNTYSKLWGNYYNSTFTMNRGYYSTTYSNNPVTWNTNTTKASSGSWLCTTGASDQNSCLNIYDFAGNLYEWTLERCSNSGYPCTCRGGNFLIVSFASSRYSVTTSYSYYDLSARLSLLV